MFAVVFFALLFPVVCFVAWLTVVPVCVCVFVWGVFCSFACDCSVALIAAIVLCFIASLFSNLHMHRLLTSLVSSYWTPFSLHLPTLRSGPYASALYIERTANDYAAFRRRRGISNSQDRVPIARRSTLRVASVVCRRLCKVEFPHCTSGTLCKREQHRFVPIVWR